MRHRRTPADTSVPPLLLNSPADLWRGVPRLIAAFCMLGFYQMFLTSGNQLWQNRYYLFSYMRMDLLDAWATLVRALLLLVLARSLWVNRPRLSWWAFVVLVIYPVCILLDLRNAYEEIERFINLGGVGLFVPPTYWQYMLACLLNNSVEVLILAVILLDLRCRRSYALCWMPWVSIASAYAFTLTLTLASDRWSWLRVMGDWASVWLTGQSLYWLQYCIAIVPITAIVLLLLGNSWAPLVCLVVGLTAVLCEVTIAWVLPYMTQSGIVALLASSAYDAGPAPSMVSLLFNQLSFQSVFIDAVAHAGPWCVIAWWAWTRPMRSPVVRGMVYPVRLCGRCGYNLHGLADRRCPECGATWTAQNEPAARSAGDAVVSG